MSVFGTLKKSLQFNRGLIWLQISVFLFNLGFGIIFPYLTLQMANIGLSIEEISYINGICPAIIIFTLPLSGLLGDLFGYKIVITTAIIITAATSTCFDLIPRAFETERHPFINMTSTSSSINGTMNFVVTSFSWPLCSGDDFSIDETNVDNCFNSPPINATDHFFKDFQDYIVCNSPFYNNETSTVVFPTTFTFNQTTDLQNGTFCQMIGPEDQFHFINNSDISCHILNHPLLVDNCITHHGSHLKTFIIYFILYLIYKMTMNSVFAILDGTILRMCKTHGSDYSVIQFYVCLAISVAPFISSLTIQDAPEGSGGETNYQIAFYAFDGFLLLSTIVLLFKVDIEMEKNDEASVFKSLKQLFSPSAFIFLANIFFSGLLWGIHDGYLFLYLGEKRGASSQVLAYLSVTGSVSCLLVVPFAKSITKYVGHMNVIYFQILVECTRFVVYSFVEMSPPYYAYGLFALDFTNMGLSWIAAITYAYKIAPPNLAATVAAITNTMHFVLAKGIAILVGGQFLSLTSSVANPDVEDVYFLGCDESKTEYCSLFRLTAVIVASGATLVLIVYYIIGRKLEKKLLQKLEDLKVGDEKKDDDAIHWNTGDFAMTRL